MSQYENIWKLLSKFSLELEENDSVDLKCLICRNIVRNAYSGPCECIFCKDCIGLYLSDGEKFCPGTSTKCKSKILNIDKNIYRNDKVNKILSKTLVKCPSYLCNHQGELLEICHHLNVCVRKVTICPYKEFGCECQLERGQMPEHLQTNLLQHNQMVVQWNINKEQQNKTDIKNGFNEINKKILENTNETNVKQEFNKQNKSIELLTIELSSVKVKNKDLASTIKEMGETIARQNKKIHEIMQIISGNKSGNSKEIIPSVNNSNFKHTYSVKSKSSTMETEPQKHSNGTNEQSKHLKRSKTAFTRNSEVGPAHRRSYQRFSEFINSFN